VATAYIAAPPQVVTITIASGSTTGTASINAAVGTQFIVWNGELCTQTTNTARSLARISISGTTLTATRANGTSDTITVKVTVIDATSSLVASSANVQYGTITITASNLTGTAAISAVTAANAALHIQGYTNAQTTSSFAAEPMLSYSGTTVTATIANVSTGSIVVGFLMIEFVGAALQSSTQAVATNWTTVGTSTTQAITSVTMGNTILLAAGQNVSSTRDYQTAQLTSSTQLTITAGAALGSTIWYRCFVIEFISAVMNSNVQRGTIAMASVTSNTATITAVGVNATIGWTGFRQNSGTTQNWNIIESHVALTNTTTVTFARNTGTGTITGAYEAIDWSTAGGATAIVASWPCPGDFLRGQKGTAPARLSASANLLSSAVEILESLRGQVRASGVPLDGLQGQRGGSALSEWYASVQASVRALLETIASDVAKSNLTHEEMQGQKMTLAFPDEWGRGQNAAPSLPVEFQGILAIVLSAPARVESIAALPGTSPVRAETIRAQVASLGLPSTSKAGVVANGKTPLEAARAQMRANALPDELIAAVSAETGVPAEDVAALVRAVTGSFEVVALTRLASQGAVELTSATSRSVTVQVEAIAAIVASSPLLVEMTTDTHGGITISSPVLADWVSEQLVRRGLPVETRILVVTPASRILSPDPENRTLAAGAENRVLLAGQEYRVIEVQVESRVLKPKKENRLI
jgi:hypothetical protein